MTILKSWLSISLSLSFAMVACVDSNDPAGQAQSPSVLGGGDSGNGDDNEPGDDCVCKNSDLPYDVKLPLGYTFHLSVAFLEKGPAPAAIVGVEMDAPQWRFSELTSDTPFEVTQADCDHEGNKSTGRDRIFVTWQNADGSTETDHLDVRYCDGDEPPKTDGLDDDAACDCGDGGAGGATAGAGGAGTGGGSTECAQACVTDADCPTPEACIAGCCGSLPN